MHEVLQAEETTPAGVKTTTTTVRPAVPTVRNLAVDAYRGLVMLLMMGEVLEFAKVSAYYNHSTFWKILAFNQTHTRVVRLFAARHDPALFLFPGRRGPPVFDPQPPTEGNSFRAGCCSTPSGDR